jgi:hypothetical protein
MMSLMMSSPRTATTIRFSFDITLSVDDVDDDNADVPPV